MSSLRVPVPSHQLPLFARPRPVPESSFLPLPLRGKLQVQGDEYHPRLRALDQYRNLRGGDGAVGGGYCSSAALGPPAGAQRSLSESLHSRYRRCAVGRAGSLLPGIWQSDSGTWSLGKSPDLTSSVCRLKFGGGRGLPAAVWVWERLGVQSGPRLVTASTSQRPALPKTVRLAGCGHVSSRQRQRRVGLRAAAGEPRMALAGGSGLGRVGMDRLEPQTDTSRHQLDWVRCV